MSSPYTRYPAVTQSNVNLYCAQCESQIGIFDNEWIRLTTSYARSKDKGTHFGTEVGNRTQVVPSGPAQRTAEGCVMAEVFCRKCSNMVGQYCKSAPDTEKQPLVNQYFYKLSRTYLKDSRSNARVDPVFGYGSDLVKPGSSRSGILPRSSAAPSSRWASTPMRQSSRTPVASVHPAPKSSDLYETRSSPLTSNHALNRGDEQSPNRLIELQEEFAAQQSTLQEQDNTITTHSKRLNDQETRLKDQQASFSDLEGYLSAQADRIVEQNEMIKDQARKFAEQQVYLSTITNQLTQLQKSMSDLKTTLLESGTNSSMRLSMTSQSSGAADGLGHVMELITNAEHNAKEVEALRLENRSMKSRLHTIASAMGAIADVQPAEENIEATTSETLNAIQVLGKRKRDEVGRPTALDFGGSALPQGRGSASFSGTTEQMPTPQASDGGQRSPVGTPSVNNDQMTDNQEGARISKNQRRKVKETAESSKATESRANNSKSAPPSSNDDYFRQPQSNQVNDREDNDVATLGLHDQAAATATKKNIEAATTIRKKRRSSRVSRIDDTTAATDATSNLEPANSEYRRVTRAIGKAAHPVVDGADQQDKLPQIDRPILVPETLAELPNIFTGNADISYAFPGPSLPTVEVASNVLGVNLEALIASSNALRQSVGPHPVWMGPVPTGTNPQLENALQGQQLMTADISETQNESYLGNRMDVAVSGGIDNETQLTNAVDFEQDSGIYDNIGASDDDDELMQANNTLFEFDTSGLTSNGTPDMTQAMHVDTAANRTDRSMAPEPIKPKKAKRIFDGKVNLDKQQLGTPQMFTAAIARGEQPKLARPPVIQARERALNEELTILGLSHWIGKKKNTKEYRDAVTKARGRYRNYNKAAYLWSKGLNHQLLDPSSMLPEGPILPVPGYHPDQRPSEAQTAPAPLSEALGEVPHTEPGTTTLDEPSAQPIVQAAEEPVTDTVEESATPAHSTRAKTRRSSVALVSGLEEVGDQPQSTQATQRSGRRKTDSRRTSKRKSDILSTMNTDAGNVDDTQIDEDAATGALPTLDDGTTMVDDGDSTEPSNSKRGKAASKPRRRPRKSAVSADDPTAHNEHDVDLVNTVDEEATAALEVASVSKIMPGISTTDAAEQPSSTDPEGEARRREDAILLRDRMAKELMEREDMDM